MAKLIDRKIGRSRVMKSVSGTITDCIQIIITVQINGSTIRLDDIIKIADRQLKLQIRKILIGIVGFYRIYRYEIESSIRILFYE